MRIFYFSYCLNLFDSCFFRDGLTKVDFASKYCTIFLSHFTIYHIIKRLEFYLHCKKEHTAKYKNFALSFQEWNIFQTYSIRLLGIFFPPWVATKLTLCYYCYSGILPLGFGCIVAVPIAFIHLLTISWLDSQIQTYIREW